MQWQMRISRLPLNASAEWLANFTGPCLPHPCLLPPGVATVHHT